MIKLIELLETNTGISWWDKNRERLNEVINSFNNWQTISRFESFEKEVVKAKIKLLREYGKQNSFSEWHYKILDEMDDFIVEFENEEDSEW